MAERKRGPYMFKMRQLPKAEYRLMQGLVSEYRFDDPCELFTAALRLVEEVSRMKDGHVADGRRWWLQVIDSVRNKAATEGDNGNGDTDGV